MLFRSGIVADTLEIVKREGFGKVTVNETLSLAPITPDIAGNIARDVALDRVETVTVACHAATGLR